MSELSQAHEELNKILDQIPASGSFESARLAQRASKLGERITELCSHPDAKVVKELVVSSDKKP